MTNCFLPLYLVLLGKKKKTHTHKKTHHKLYEVKRMRKKNNRPAFSISYFMLIPENGQLQAKADSQKKFPEGKAVLSQSPGIHGLVIPEREGIWDPNTK